MFGVTMQNEGKEQCSDARKREKKRKLKFGEGGGSIDLVRFAAAIQLSRFPLLTGPTSVNGSSI